MGKPKPKTAGSGMRKRAKGKTRGSHLERDRSEGDKRVGGESEAAFAKNTCGEELQKISGIKGTQIYSVDIKSGSESQNRLRDIKEKQQKINEM